MLIFGSYVMGTYESCQGRNAAALSRTVHLTRGRLEGVLLGRLPNDIDVVNSVFLYQGGLIMGAQDRTEKVLYH